MTDRFAAVSTSAHSPGGTCTTAPLASRLNAPVLPRPGPSPGDADLVIRRPASSPTRAAGSRRAVIGLNLCRFAKAVHVKGQVHYAVSFETGWRRLLRSRRAQTPCPCRSRPGRSATPHC